MVDDNRNSPHKRRSLRNCEKGMEFLTCDGCEDIQQVTMLLVLTKKLMFDKTYEKIGVARSHFCTHSHAISLFVVVTTE